MSILRTPLDINKTADRVMALILHLEKAGFVDEAIEVARKNTELSDELDVKLPITKADMMAAILRDDTQVYQARERMMAAYYELWFNPYEALSD